MTDLAPLALALVHAIWPASARRSPDAEPIALAAARAVTEDPEGPALGSSEEDLKAEIANAYFESSLRAHAAGDCTELATGHRMPMGYATGEVPKGVTCMSFGAWQQASRAGQGDLDEQARAWLVLLHRSVRECPSHPLAWLLSGAPRGSRGTHLSDYRMLQTRRIFASVAAPDELAMQRE